MEKVKQKIYGIKTLLWGDMAKRKQKYMLHSRKISIFLGIILLWLLRFSALWQDTVLLEQHQGLPFVVEGRVFSCKPSAKGFEYYLQAGKIKKVEDTSFQKNNLNFLFYFPQEIPINSVIKIEGNLASFFPAQNLGDWDVKKYFRSKNIYYQLRKVKLLEVVGKEEGLPTWRESLKIWIEERIAYIFPKQEQDLFLSLFVGERHRLDKKLVEIYRKAGVSHILAVSGLHVALIVLGMQWILKKIPLPYWLQYFVLIVILVGYLILTGMQASTMRAVLMLAVLEATYFLDRPKDGKAALKISFVVLLFYNPFYIYDVGFILSFSTIASLLYIHPFLFAGKSQYMQMIGVTLTTQIMILPILSIYFHKFSVVAVITNLWVIPAISYFLGLGMVALIISSFSIVLAQVIAGLGYFLSQITLKILEWVVAWQWAELPIRAMTWQEIILFYIIIFLALHFNRRKLLWGLLGFIIIFIPYYFTPHFSMLNVGQAESMVLQYKNHTFVIDVGLDGNRSTVNYLAYCGKQRVDMVFLSHLDKDHAGGLKNLAEYCHIEAVGISKSYALLNKELAEDLGLEKVYQSYVELVDLLNRKGIPIYYWQAGDRMEVDELSLEFLYPNEEEIPLTSNDFSFVGEISYRNSNLLLTGDIGKEVEELLLERKKIRPITVLKVAHHGSKYASSQSFLEATKPILAIISCGRYNRYGHPSQEAVNRFKIFETEVRSTAWDGQLFLRFTQRGDVMIDE